MKPDQIMQIFHDTAYVRMGGTQEELKTAEYLRQRVADMGLEASLEAFSVDMADMEADGLWVDGEAVTCKGYRNAGSGTVEAQQPKEEKTVREEESGRFARIRQRNALRHELKKAIHEENFERAAEIRDELRTLEGKEENKAG